MKQLATLGLCALMTCLAAPARAAGPDTVRVGVYLTSLYDLNLGENSFTVDFWVWFIYKNDSLNPLETLEVANAKDFSFSSASVEKKEGYTWATQKVKATIKKVWDTRHFPFDNQDLVLELEETEYDTTRVVYVADGANSSVDAKVTLEGWRLQPLQVKTLVHRYPTTFGDPGLKVPDSTYPQLLVTVPLFHNGTSLFIKLFTGVYVAFFIAWLALFLDPLDIDARFGLPVGGLFAAVGNKYILDGIVPEVAQASLGDKIHVAAFIGILAVIVTSVASLNLKKKEKEALSGQIDRRARWVVLGLFVAVNIYLVVTAVVGGA